MSLLYPEFLWALGLNIVPIIIHLFNLQKHETIYFSDLTLLKSIKQETKRRSKLKNLLVLLFRILIISSLVIAFCYPYKNKDEISTNTIDNKIAIYIDNSFSMQREGDNQSLFENSKDHAIQLIQSQAENTQFYLTSNSKKKNKYQPLNKDQIINEITNLSISPYSLNSSQIIEIQKEQTHLKAPKSYWFTDLQKKDFSLNNLNLSDSMNISLIHYQSSNNYNLSIDSIWFSDKIRSINKQEELNIKIHNQSNMAIDVQCKLNINEKEQQSQKLITIKAFDSKVIKMHYKLTSNGIKHAFLELSEYPFIDHLFDDRYYFSYNINEQFKISHVYDNEINNKKAFQTLFKDIEQTNFRSFDINDELFEDKVLPNLIILDQLQNINKEITTSLLNERMDNIHLLIIPNLDIVTSNYHDLLNPFQVTFTSTDTNKLSLDKINIKHPFFNVIFEQVDDNMDLPDFNNHFIIKDLSYSNILLQYENEQPFLIQKTNKQKNIFLLTSSIDKANSNFTNHALFVPIFLRIQEMCKQNDIFHFPINKIPPIKIANKKQNQNITIQEERNKSNTFYPLTKKELGSIQIHTENQIEKAGAYNILNNDSITEGFSVNYSRDESEMNFYSEEEINIQIQNSNLTDQITYYKHKENNTIELLTKGLDKKSYWMFFILLALLFITLEIVTIRSIN